MWVRPIPVHTAANASQVSKFVDAAAYGYEAAHIMYGLKHFPGIGRSAVDSHEASSVITTSKSELSKVI